MSERNYWSVTVRVNGDEVLTIEPRLLSGVPNIEEFADEVRACGEHLLAFIGEERSAIHVPPTCPENGEKLTGQGWRDIETAPMDGTLILACQRPDEGGCWFKTWEQWKAPQTIAWRSFHANAPGKEQWRDAKGSPVTPDLWMPLDGLAVQP